MFFYDIFSESFWRSVLGKDFKYLYLFVQYAGVGKEFWIRVFPRFVDIVRKLLKIKEVRLYIMEIVRKEGDSLFVRRYENFKPTRKMISFANWVVENSGVLRQYGTDLGSLARASGVNLSLLKRWYNNPAFVQWLNEYCIEKLGFAISLLKTSIIGEALSQDATFQERKFALELVGELPRYDEGKAVKIYIFGKEISITDGKKDERDSY